MRITLWLILALSICWSGHALAGTSRIDRDVDYRLAEGVSRMALPNGLTLLVKPEPHARTVALDLVTRVGAAQEDMTNSGICKLVGHLLERRLSQPAGQADDLLERTGTITSVNASLDYTEFSIVTNPDSSAEILKRLLSAYGRRPFDSAEIGDERQKMVKLLESGQGDFNGVYDIFLSIFYRYHPYRQPLGGNAVALHRLTDDQVNAFIQRWYAPNRTILSVVGKFDGDLKAAVSGSSLGSLKKVAEPSEIITWEPVSTEKEVPLVGGQRMAFLFLGYPAPPVQSMDYPAMRVLNAVMGFGVSSRLWLDLREERGLAYELGSEYPTLEGPAHFLSFVITNPSQVRASRHRIFAEIDRIRKEDVPEAELDSAKWKVAGSLLASIETPRGQASQLAVSEAQGVGYQFTDRLLSSVDRVTAADVRRCANKYLDNYTLLVARPPGTEPILPDHL